MGYMIMSLERMTIGLLTVVLFISVVSGAMMTGVLATGSDGDNSRETATEMAANGTETGTIEGKDTDWYAVDVETGERIWVELELGSPDENAGEHEGIRFDIFGPSGKEVNEYPSDGMGPIYSPGSAFASGYGGTIAETAGTYYVKVDGQNISSYDLTVQTQRLDEHDPNEQPATATSIEPGTTQAVMSGSDVDTFTIDLEEGETINVTASDIDSKLVNVQLVGPDARDETIDSPNNEYVVNDGPASTAVLNHTANQSGTYYIRVYPYEEGIGSFDDEDPYELSITAANEYEGSSDEDTDVSSDSDSGTSTTVVTSQPRTSQSEAETSQIQTENQRDDMNTPTTANETVTASTESQNSQLGPLVIVVIALVALLITVFVALRYH